MAVKVCIIGCGMIAQKAHIPAYRANKGFEITAVFDTVEATAKSVCETFGIKSYYTDADQMLEKEKPDVVSVCSPNKFHKAHTLKALSYGANVLCEKPLATTLSDADEMFALAKKQGKILMACQTLRFLPERLAVKAMADSGELGEVYYAELSRIRRRGIPTWGRFHLKEYSGGGALIDIGVHGLDSAIWLMGNPNPVSVNAVMNKVHIYEIGSAKQAGALKGGVNTAGFNPDEMNVESFSEGNIRFENGAALSFKVAWSANLCEENNIVLAGLNKGVDTEQTKIYRGAKTTHELKVTPNGFTSDPFYGHFCIINNMYECLTEKAEPFVKPEETINVSAILEAAYLSAESGHEITIKK